ncbi:hypothetical protein COJ41_14915 [Bacillus thuringiensis]|uniref:zinc-ribbon domain-containing protein n=1 Tax=Bacillus thuringiensis TaxID=1428 RepID=UPI000BF3B402|nr:zinc-ribbon domain-containing protein [Bacillus thuringiensis]PFM22979.1 hypothetical protein COJ41_14915 [Bacillus thuringiensis]PFN57866.1 hypothetical protein COJ58_05265 [Bacillus thuringiensis]
MTTIQEIKLLALERNGKCLSEKFEGWKYKLKWECELGHVWEATLGNVKYGKWCPICGRKNRGLRRRDKIENMHRLAKQRGGECLSQIYEGSSKHLEWKCEKNHVWKASPDNIKAGKWCPICGREEAASKRRKTLADMQTLAELNNGKCISSTYTNMSTHLEWECEHGHRWFALPSNISRGKWCPYCNGRYRTIEQMHEFAKKRGGKCLSAIFIRMTDKLFWECSKGHKWEATPNSLFNSKSWCPECAGNITKNLAYCESLANEKGGKCLSEQYKGIDEKMLWECANGHKFKVTPYSVSCGTWCPICNNNRKNLNEEKCRYIFESLFKKPFEKCRKVLGDNLELDGYNENLKLAFEFNGIQHYQFNSYFHKDMSEFHSQIERDNKKQILCNEKRIKLITIPYTIESDRDKELYIIREIENLNVIIEEYEVNWFDFYKGYEPLKEMLEIASQNNGECLSITYNGVDGKLLWRCERGHIWKSSPYQVKKGSWCPRCSGRKKTIEDMQILAELKGGRCLSKSYINNSTKLCWECSKGHIWEAIPSSIQRGTWCPECNGNKQYGLEDMLNVAKERGGECISKQYINFASKMRWKCGKGHIWEATPASIVAGSWCKECLKPSLEDAKNIANEYGGECLSESYIDSRTKMKWKCLHGHIWESILGSVKRGRWCPKCNNLKKEQKKHSKLLELQKIAFERNGKCLSEHYENIDKKMLWECAEGHRWESSTYSIKRGAWCGKCAVKKNADRLRGTIEEMYLIANERGGKCLSDNYINNHTPLEWECSKGHRWMSTANTIKNGSWCRKCNVKKNADRQRKSIEDIQKLAAKKNGECLADAYVNAHTKLKWKCSEGHIWEAKPNNIQQGKWCPICRKKKK